MNSAEKAAKPHTELEIPKKISFCQVPIHFPQPISGFTSQTKAASGSCKWVFSAVINPREATTPRKEQIAKQRAVASPAPPASCHASGAPESFWSRLSTSAAESSSSSASKSLFRISGTSFSFHNFSLRRCYLLQLQRFRVVISFPLLASQLGNFTF